jgi:hypothetical protein
VPTDLPPKSTIHDYVDLWDWDGTLERIHEALYLAVREKPGERPAQRSRSSTPRAPRGRKKGGVARSVGV